ncbi:MAG: cobalt ECF transporter T component CbiQ [Anaerolineae bacterium]|nr:cobalt ECF transporter T component CbiQ [Anaerolineae bacterium]MDW8100924.1 cobalt ECF transporter T component CbiQ [Anaerolineae bacterium]
MDWIDRYAYSNRIRTLDPAYKAGLALAVILLCLVLNRPAVGLLAVGWIAGLLIGWAGVPAHTVLRVLLSEATFLALAVGGVALSVGLGSVLPDDARWSWRLGPLWLSSSPAALELAATLISRALGCAAAMSFLSLTTPLVDLIDLARRLHAPPLLVDLATLIYRFVFVLLGTLEQMRIAQSNRLGYANFRRGMASAALLASRLWLEAYRRSQRLQIALESRGYAGELRVLPNEYQHSARAVGLTLVISASLLAASGTFL